MAKAEQEIDVGGPRADAVQRGECVVAGVDVFVSEDVEVQPVGRDLFGDEFQRLDLGGRKAQSPEPVGASLADRFMVERIEGLRQALPDSRRAGGGKLLAADD